ncbi:PREDICTED: rapamycin-insensitive companion of mTOR [Nipponia nippon]|uniref:rapamycin-insensitive companion of mTOR n=1 Tax=Nipponia nippon TaxID=128390 RepID=UPI000510D82B|nr:PREDICTED: rapamycin-insensitive companion of mTOR [Nipponia nippon]
MREILQNVAKLQGVSNMRKLGHLNNFTKLLCSTGHAEEKLGFTYDSIIICLRLALLNEAKEVRAAGLRALRYLIRDSSILQKVLKLKVDYLIARCIDIQQSNEVERTQALRLVRKMITVNASLFPSSITNSLIAVGNDGLQERDRMVRACIAIICELALQNPEVVALRGGLSTILKNVIDCQLSRINEALITTVLHLINHPKTRQYVRADVELERILAPYTDFHYRHNPDTAEGQLKEDREARFLASKMGIVAAFRSWAGIISLCKPGNSGIQSLIGVLCIPNMEIRQGLLEVLYDIFRLPLPVVAEEFIEALLSVDPSRFQDCWRLSDGFVAAEAKTILPHRARSRPDLMDNYLALVLSAFIANGLLEGLVEVITSSDDHVSVRATILLGELLHMANTILPHSHSHHLHCLPTLMNMAASFDIMKEKRLRASAALNCLKHFHEMKKRGPKPYSLHLDHIIQKAISTHQKRDQYRVQKDIFILKDTEEALVMNLRDSQVLNHKENLEWNWNLIGTILKWPNVNLRNYKDEQLHRFVRRLLYFYKPSSKLYANLDLDYAKAKQLTVVGCQFTEFLLESEEDGQGYLEELVKDIVNWLNSSSGMKPEHSLQNNGLLNTLSQHYFLFFGTLSCHPHGVKMLEKCNVFQCDHTSTCQFTFMANWCTIKQAAIYWSLRTCVYVLGLIAKTKQGCDILKHHNWDAVRHSRRQPWPVVPDDVEQLCNELSSIPSTLSLNSESTSSRHNSESESTPSSMFIMEDDRFGSTSTSTFFLDITEDAEQIFYDRPGPSKDKDRSPFPFFSSSRLVKNRILNSLTLPNKKHRSSSDPKGGKLTSDSKSGLRRNRTVTEPSSSIDFPAGEEFSPVFRIPKIQTLQLETSFVGSKHMEDTDSTPSIGENDLKLPKGLGNEIHRENTSRERLIGDGTTQTHFKSRSLSFNTDTTTSGISSMSSSPSRETVGVDTTNVDTDCGSLSTVVSARTVKPSHCSTPQSNHLPLSKSNSVSLVPPGSSHTLPRRAQSLKAPSLATIKSLADYNFSYTSSRDAFGYATLKRLQQQRMHPSLSHSEALASPAKDVLFTDTITMKSGSLDSRLTPSRFMKALSYASLDKEDLLSPINQNTLQRSSSVRSMVSNATYGSSDDYIGLALPVDINEIFQVKETPYFQKKTTPPFDDRGARVFAPNAGGLPSGTSDVVKSPFQMLRQQISLTEIMNTSRSDASQFLENTEDTGLQEHTDENCLYCVCIQILGYQPNNKVNSSYSCTDFSDIPYTDWCGQTIHNHLDVHSSKFSGISSCSDAVSHGSASSTKSTELVLGVKSIPDDTPVCRILLRKEVLRLVINLSSSVGTKGHETGLLTIKEKYPQAFDDICLYSEVSYLLAHCTFRLPSRRFIQELFQDVQFLQMHEEAEAILATPTKQTVIETSVES